MTFDQWQQLHPQAARDLAQCFTPDRVTPDSDGHSEAWAQQRVRMQAARAGAYAWRNNVGATPAKCPDCDAPQRPVRYGLANDSAKVNAKIKSSDLILAVPRKITPDDVGSVIAQFGSVECKAPGWQWRGNERERAQLAWITLVNRCGGYACFSTGEIAL